jgi:hypothetical protein
MLAISRVYGGGDWQNNLTATPSTTQVGTSLTTGATPNVKTAYTQLFAATTYDVYGFWFYYSGSTLSANITNFLLDIAIGAGGSEQVILPDYQVGWAGVATTGMTGLFIPLFIPRGTRISMRAQSSLANDNVRILLFLNRGASGYIGQLFTNCDTYGANLANSGGTAHTAGNSGAESTPATIGTTTRPYGAVSLSVNGTTGTTTAVAYHWELMIGGTTQGEWHTVNTTAESVYGPFPQTPMYISIPASTALQIRGECSGTAQSQEIAFHCFY